MAINTLVQGSAADFVKFALVRIMKTLKDSNLEPLLQLHDEWIFRTDAAPETDDFGQLVARLREAADAANGLGISVPIPCRIAFGSTYGDMNPC
jgi:DNA polymerase-1